ncbi:hypothetical protein STSP1_01162 [Sedimentisphaera salicampi]|uniref:Uncharacterized protein n=1 Tax=Sedimentisphaera salicampi TaxID=1941349 RepID=A0A1W6LLY5_9BACT|nr:hypothetical protein STSP1_01162 [Sedimentisphaera salicampi]
MGENSTPPKSDCGKNFQGSVGENSTPPTLDCGKTVHSSVGETPTPPTPNCGKNFPKVWEKRSQKCGRNSHVKEKNYEKSNVDEPSGYVFELKGGKDYSLPKAKLEEYENTFAEVDIDSEFRKAQQWLRDNPAKRKTAAGMPRFLGSWLSRAQGSLKPKAQPAGEIFQRRDPTPEDLEIAFGKRGLD